MGQFRWRGRVGPPSLFISTGLLLLMLFPAAMSAGPLGGRPAAPTACTALDIALSARQRAAAVAQRVESLIESNGVLAGRTLAVQPRAGRGPVAVTLPAESFVSPARGDLIVYGSHRAGTGSEVHVLDAASGCGLLLARPPEVVRSAVLDPEGAALYVHSVAEDDRRDLGVTRIDLLSGETTLAVEPLPASSRYGRTFSTEMHWSAERDALAVQSCGATACRTRVLNIGTGAVQMHDDPPHGALIGIVAGTLYAHAACHWSPCEVISIDLASGDTALVESEAHAASLTADDAGPLLRIETAEGAREVRP